MTNVNGHMTKMATIHVIAYQLAKLFFGKRASNFNCFFDDFSSINTLLIYATDYILSFSEKLSQIF